uniref:Uncharacterized protein n=1 Tax=Tanacetum cinerariifolium TaxID=118510 RepID=A0A699JZ66_TANCI|nr:hypothetical protein [Tanacetum cinerariifolium]
MVIDNPCYEARFPGSFGMLSTHNHDNQGFLSILENPELKHAVKAYRYPQNTFFQSQDHTPNLLTCLLLDLQHLLL